MGIPGKSSTVNICIACGYPSDGELLCLDCRDGIAWAKNQRLQLETQRRERVVTHWGQIACEMLALYERSPEMRQMQEKGWAYLLSKVHPIYGARSTDAYKMTRDKLCEYLHDHLGKEPNLCSKPTPPQYTDWLWVATEVCQFIKDNPAMRQLEPEVWEWVLNQTYPLPPNHAPTARNMTKAILEQFMGDYAPTVMMIQELEGRMEAERLAKGTTKTEQLLGVPSGTVLEWGEDKITAVPGLLTPEAAEQLEEQPKPTPKRRRQ